MRWPSWPPPTCCRRWPASGRWRSTTRLSLERQGSHAAPGSSDHRRRGQGGGRLEGHRLALPQSPRTPAEPRHRRARRGRGRQAGLHAEPDGAGAEPWPLAPDRPDRGRHHQPLFGGRAARRREGLPGRRLPGDAVQPRQRHRPRARGHRCARRLPGRRLHPQHAGPRRRPGRCRCAARQARRAGGPPACRHAHRLRLAGQRRPR